MHAHICPEFDRNVPDLVQAGACQIARLFTESAFVNLFANLLATFAAPWRQHCDEAIGVPLTTHRDVAGPVARSAGCRSMRRWGGGAGRRGDVAFAHVDVERQPVASELRDFSTTTASVTPCLCLVEHRLVGVGLRLGEAGPGRGAAFPSSSNKKTKKMSPARGPAYRTLRSLRTWRVWRDAFSGELGPSSFGRRPRG